MVSNREAVKIVNYLIYFDESNKIDQFNKKFSYYGAYGGTDSDLARIVKRIDNLNRELKSHGELHFREYTKDTHVKKYFRVLHTVINEDVRINILIVNNEDALLAASKIGLSTSELRNLFYIKIPERLFYGMTRDLTHLGNVEDKTVNVKIKIDRNGEYDKLGLNEKIIEQMNAHSAYRNKNYRVNKVISLDSEKSIPLQIVDTFMGIVVYLLEQTYLDNSDSSKIKSDLIYRFLSQGNNLIRFQEQIRLFEWTGREELNEINISNHLSPFMVYKTNYDVQEIVKIQSLIAKAPTKPKAKKTSFANRGMTLEEFINQSNEYYNANGIAVVHKKPTPIQVVHSNGAKIIGYYSTPSQLDYNGVVYPGRYIDFECKETRQKSLPLSNFHPHQIKHMKQVIKQQGISFVIIRFVVEDEIYVLDALHIIEFWDNQTKGGRKSIPLDYVKEHGNLILLGFNPVIDYLAVL